MIGIYARVSTEEQARSGFSLQDQLRACREKAATDEVIEYVDEGISGEFLDRQALSMLRQDVREGRIKRIICLDPDRLSRKLMHQLLLTDEWDGKGVELQFVNGDYSKTPEGQLFYSMRGAIAEFEKAKINERMSRGRREKARQGRVLRDFQIYGYDYDKHTESLVINPEEAAVIRQIFQLFTTPHTNIQGMNGIANWLTEQGIPTKRGAKKWHRQVVRQILTNRTYLGMFYQNRWNTEGMLANRHDPMQEKRAMRERPVEEWIGIPCPAIISQEMFEQAQLRLEETRRRFAGKSLQAYLLSGLVRCGECGEAMIGKQVHNWGKRAYEYADRKRSASTNHSCGNKIRCQMLDSHVWEAISKWLRNESALAQTSLQAPSQESASHHLAALKRERQKAAAAKQRLLKLYATGQGMAEAELWEAMEQWAKKEERLIAQIAEEEKRREEQQDEPDQKGLLQEAVIHYLQTAPQELSLEDRRELIRHIVREVRVYHQAIEIITF
ncbi:recombinase family protein [Brevibacillus migulae]|uniref:recombinase family protein n=1 Tax=Brevibacillus migulae TaxID=1644114 RepID=UPI00106EBD37|nr:recombinase family protein [Brevibacillus migulae]